MKRRPFRGQIIIIIILVVGSNLSADEWYYSEADIDISSMLNNIAIFNALFLGGGLVVDGI